MNQSRIAKALARTAVVSWREQPTQYDIEALRANIERVGLVIRVRWAIVTALAVFSVVAAGVYGTAVPVSEFRQNMVIPALALVFVLGYNAFYQWTYRRVGNVAFLNQAQLIFDIIVTTVLVYYSGGVYSWFSSMYLLFILEGAFILPRRSHVWLLVGLSSAFYGLVLLAVYQQWIPHVAMPFVTNHLWDNGTYVIVRYLWKVTMYGGAGMIGILMMQRIHARERELRDCAFSDELTGLFNRQYFHRVLASETERARRDGRSVAVFIADVDRFGEINRVFGVDVGDEMLAVLGKTLIDVARDGSINGVYEVNVPCRIGGEEMAIIVPEVAGPDDEIEPVRGRVLAMAEEFRTRVERLAVRGLSVTVSVGVAVFPADGDSVDALLDHADAALDAAAGAGGNRVVASDGPVGDADHGVPE
ncbi:MAG: GGDEF domain-containing protein [Coriobacteriia bacterium]